jgi:hypothetical protein
VGIADEVAPAGEDEVDVLVQLPHATEIECYIGMGAMFQMFQQRSNAKYDAGDFNQWTTSERLFDQIAANLRGLTAAVRNSNKQGVSLG